jgi:hypothetical protein
MYYLKLRTSLTIPHRSRRYADRLDAAPAIEGLDLDLCAPGDTVSSIPTVSRKVRSRSEPSSHGVKVHGRHVHRVYD